MLSQYAKVGLAHLVLAGSAVWLAIVFFVDSETSSKPAVWFGYLGSISGLVAGFIDSLNLTTTVVTDEKTVESIPPPDR